MKTRELASEYCLSHWAGVIQERSASGLSVRAYCKQSGYHENMYYYWQRKLRDSGAGKKQSGRLSTAPPAAETQNIVPSGWVSCSHASVTPTHANALELEVNDCRLTVTADTDMDLLQKVCGMLKSLC